MTRDWTNTTVGDQITLQRGFDITVKEQTDGHVPVISSSGISSFHNVSQVKGPGVVIGRKGSLGTVFYVEQEYWPHDTTLWVRDFHGNFPKFVYYFLKNLKVIHLDVGSANPTLNRNHVHPIKTWWPPLAEQRAIAQILSSLDDKIELNRRMNATLEELARTIFQSWFVDFDPVRAKAAGRAPSGLDAATAALFPASFEEIDGRMVPSGWGAVPLTEAIEVNPSRRLAVGEEASYLDMQNMPTQGHRADNWAQRIFSSGMRFANGDTLLARITPCLENGKTAFVDFLEENEVGWGSTEYIVLRPKAPLPSEFAYYLARSELFRSFAIGNMTGTTGRQRVPTSSLAHFQAVIPSSSVAIAFGEMVRNLMTRVKANSEQSRTLATLRDALLPQLMAGELRVRDAERLVEEQP